MASCLKRLASIRTLSSITGLVRSKSHTRLVENLLAPRLASATTSSDCFSVGQRASKHYSTDPGTTVHPECALNSRLQNDGEVDHQDYLRWGNGGGTFHKTASIDPSAFVEIGAVVHSECAVGAECRIGCGAIIGPTVTIGQSTKIGYNVALANCMVGDFCVIHSGVCIGQDGFGFFVDEQGNMVKKPQIGHNVVIGRSCIICGQVGVAGSVTIGDYVTFGGRVGIRDHVNIASKVRLAANSCVTKDISEPGDYGGFPAIPIRDWRRQIAIHRQSLKSTNSLA
uniref:Probable UDP-3-O-acylglucosamine N-acyltransferase 2, mitochondrial isoform X3 n=1 Tax=Nicotiana sylvestris TaxID=4096 RepID=A0A1U7WT39_NICSY|nr:PREDICTED: probable UDP-3-O-acylglucosamine N-acyltransferase 2, mitochondrial isoform X3 [Nicotiana sylvestris]